MISNQSPQKTKQNGGVCYISPSVQIYKTPTSVLLITLHRLGCVFVFLGLLVITWTVIAYINSMILYDMIMELTGMHSIFLLLFSWIFAFSYCFFSDIRAFIWDLGYGLDPKHIMYGDIVVVICSLLMGVLFWFDEIRVFMHI